MEWHLWPTGALTHCSALRVTHGNSVQSKRVITFLQTQNPHGIQGINQGEAQAKPFTESFGHRLQFIMAPSKLSVTFPSMEKGLNHPFLALIRGT